MALLVLAQPSSLAHRKLPSSSPSPPPTPPYVPPLPTPTPLEEQRAAMGQRVFMKSVGKMMSGDTRVHWLHRLPSKVFGFQT